MGSNINTMSCSDNLITIPSGSYRGCREEKCYMKLMDWPIRKIITLFMYISSFGPSYIKDWTFKLDRYVYSYHCIDKQSVIDYYDGNFGMHLNINCCYEV